MAYTKAKLQGEAPKHLDKMAARCVAPTETLTNLFIARARELRLEFEVSVHEADSAIVGCPLFKKSPLPPRIAHPLLPRLASTLTAAAKFRASYQRTRTSSLREYLFCRSLVKVSITNSRWRENLAAT